MIAPHFDKYDRKGAYHWREYFGGLRPMSARRTECLPKGDGLCQGRDIDEYLQHLGPQPYDR